MRRLVTSLRTLAGCCAFLALSGALAEGRSTRLTLITGSHKIQDGESAFMLGAALEHRPSLKEVEIESFEYGHSFGWGLDASVLNTLVESGEPDYFQLGNLDVFGAYYYTKNLPGRQFWASFALRARIDQSTLATTTIGTWTVKPEVKLELPLTHQTKGRFKRIAPIQLYVGYAFSDEFVNDTDVDLPFVGDRWEIDVEWTFLRGKWGGTGLEGIELGYKGSFCLFDDAEDYSFNMFSVKKMIGKKGAITLDVGSGERPPEFVDYFIFSVGYTSAF